MIAAGLAALARARSAGRPPGRYRLQAEIAAVHATAASAELTDWSLVVALYDALLVAASSPVVALNRAVAVGYRDGPAAGLTELERLSGSGELAGYHLLAAVRADLLRRSGRTAEALAAYREALDLVRTAAERRFLERRVDELTNG
jgi:RNA polymerase sigma-70 factor (ECF subfamily)